MTTTAKRVIKIVLVIVFILSVGANAYIFHKYSAIKNKVEVIVDDTIDTIHSDIVEKNEELNEEYTDTISELEESFRAPEVIYKDLEPLVDEDGRTFVISKINGEEYKFYLSDNISESQQQVVFYADRLNFVTSKYETEVQRRNEMITELERQLEQAKADLKRDLTDAEMQELVNNVKLKFFRFGIDIWVFDNLPVSEWITNGKVDRWGYFSAGIGANFLFMNKLNLRVSVGMQQQIDNSLNPTVGFSIGWYF